MSGDTVQLQRCVDRLRAGEQTARDELIRFAHDRLSRLTRRMLRQHADVRRWEQTDDVLQNALIRLHRALQNVELADARHFLRLAAQHLRWELTDLARRYTGPEALLSKHRSGVVHGKGAADSGQAALDPADATHDPQRLAEWSDFHEHVDRLPDDERAVFDLLWYHGFQQDEAADLLQVDARTIRRKWRAARLRLTKALGQSAPPLE